jgi:arginyl-tRNA synthetase
MLIKNHIKQTLNDALVKLEAVLGHFPESLPEIQVEYTRDKQFGDFASNIALLLAKIINKPPREIAALLIEQLSYGPRIAKVEIAGPGFINFYLTPTALHPIIEEILASNIDFGRSDVGKDVKINFEFVSANPTGPLHVGHGRSVAFGAACANLLKAAGFQVHREYYVNDAGRQMDILAVSVWLRYLTLCGEQFVFPSNGYQGDYIQDIARELKQKHTETLHWNSNEVFHDVPPDFDEARGTGDKEAHIDALIVNAKKLLGETSYLTVHNLGLTTILDDIRQDLEEFGVTFDEWFSERQLLTSKVVEQCVAQLQQSGHTYERDHHLWFRATDFGDDKDRVLIRKDGRPTYFASDIAYHMNKFNRHAEKLVDVLGADHHGYVNRIRGALTAFGIPKEKMDVVLVQFAVLYRGKEKVQMSTRSGSFITLRKLRDEVGKDAARFFYVMRKADQHLDFDLNLAKSQSQDNPVYYIQYAHARICSVFRQLVEKKGKWNQELGLQSIDLLLEPQEKMLIEQLSRYCEVLEAAALSYGPHLLANYLRDLAHDFHTYYNAHPFLVDHPELCNARLCLIAATRQVIVNGLTLLGVSAPEVM